MKKLISYRLQKIFSFVILGAIFLVAYQANPDFFRALKVESATNTKVLGYAWANTPQSSGTPIAGINQGLGWISMNGASYGVVIDLDTGNFSGQAWIGNGNGNEGSTGWVDFAPTGPYPGVPLHGVRKEGNVLTGWAKVLSMNNEYPDMGWIKFSKDVGDAGVDYGVTVDANGVFSGYAWGSEVIGWVDFAPAIAGVDRPHIENPPCTAGVVIPSGGSWGSCADDPTFCEVNPPGTAITGTQIGICGFGYSGNATQSCSTGKTCGSSCTTNSNCGGGEVCLPGTLKCGSPSGGCGNNTCDVGENITSCPQDCKGKFQQF